LTRKANLQEKTQKMGKRNKCNWAIKYVLPVLVDVGVGSCATRKIGLLRGPFKRLILKPWPNVATPPPLRER